MIAFIDPLDSYGFALFNVSVHLMHSLVAYISASAKLRAVMDCRLEIQCIGLFVQSKNPDMDLLLKSSRCGVLPSLGTDASCGPQFASVKGVVDSGSMGNLT